MILKPCTVPKSLKYSLKQYDVTNKSDNNEDKLS